MRGPSPSFAVCVHPLSGRGCTELEIYYLERESQLTPCPDKTSICEELALCRDVGWFLALMIGGLENVVDSLGIGNPQTLFLWGAVSIYNCGLKPDSKERSIHQAPRSNELQFHILPGGSSQQ